jgi:hypothetical protein
MREGGRGEGKGRKKGRAVEGKRGVYGKFPAFNFQGAVNAFDFNTLGLSPTFKCEHQQARVKS